MKQISIIIPTYNMENYIGKCIESLIIPEFNLVEVIVVNDGSKDRSSEIAHEYARRFPESIKVVDKTNGNYGSCINTALSLLSGRYIKILDADDTFDTNSFSEFVRFLPKCESDVIVTGYKRIDTALQKDFYTAPIKGMQLSQETTVLKKLSPKALKDCAHMHKLCYKSNVFSRFKYNQTEGISYTDTEWAVIPFAFCQTITLWNIYLYNYLIGREGQTMSSEQIGKQLKNLMPIVDKLLSHLQLIPKDEHILSYYNIRLHLFFEWLYTNAIHYWSKEIADIIKTTDMKIQSSSPSLFREIATIPYDVRVNYRPVEVIRKRNYPLKYKIPLWVKCLISYKTHFEKK